MRILIVEDEFTSRKLLTALLADYGECDTASDGVECVDRFREALVKGSPYDLVCMDIMMPNKDGHQALKEIRELEQEFECKPSDEAKVIMVTALNDPKTVVKGGLRRILHFSRVSQTLGKRGSGTGSEQDGHAGFR
ncbi:response regulator [Pseudodesulfovibrio tunisiensis]|uniref:response regulator n=1 Tax=Pseudodesulfovibrio tunisiensis TaxID=463192 RepID=UPI001FB30B64|nr:response regulator [Pseudodesulfovibrio tunisiensis]